MDDRNRILTQALQTEPAGALATKASVRGGLSVGMLALSLLATGCTRTGASPDAGVVGDGRTQDQRAVAERDASDSSGILDSPRIADEADTRANLAPVTEVALETTGPDGVVVLGDAQEAATVDFGHMAGLDSASESAPRDLRAEVWKTAPDGDGASKDAADGAIDRATAGDVSSGDEAGREAGDSTCASSSGCAGSNWALWPMPNTAADVANGAPHPTILVDNGDDTVTDQVTGLKWQRSATVTLYTREDAQAHCAKLRTGGYSDWRMPSAIELVSIANFDKSDPSVDVQFFPDTPLDLTSNPRVPVGYEVTTSVAGSPLAGWLVDFAFGMVALDTTSLDRPAFLRCVRGPRAPQDDTSSGRYDLSTAGLALDTKTGLTWQRTAPGSRRKLADAQAYCATGTGLPGTGWRLPTIKELMTLVDFAKANKFRIDQTVFNAPTDVGDPYSVFWSATSEAGKSPFQQFTSGTWSVYFDSGENNYTDSSGYSFVRCVR